MWKQRGVIDTRYFNTRCIGEPVYKCVGVNKFFLLFSDTFYWHNRTREDNLLNFTLISPGIFPGIFHFEERSIAKLRKRAIILRPSFRRG